MSPISSALAQTDALRAPLPAAVKVKQGMLNVPALSPLWLLPEYAAKYNVHIETVMFQRFADARTALASGDIQLTAFGPQDISLALGQGTKSLIGVAGVGSGNDCLVVRKGEDIKDLKSVSDKRIGVGAGSSATVTRPLQSALFPQASRSPDELVAHNVMADDDSRTNASPAISNGQILLRTDRRLYCIGNRQ